MTHTCHAPHCTRVVPPRMFACREHWFALPKRIRDAIWQEYRPGQERDKQPSLRYLAVQRFACAHLAFRTHDEAAARESAAYLDQALRYAEEAYAQRPELGNPLEGLTPVPTVVKKARRRAKKL